ncbi:hypothetical protein PoB_002928700 [Plakobranchus ocellatus]|uniref:Uncharacterized protein n=1 Tax=Plakobranchus ocellatus TaxID=259542 RepID=A0AAV4A689_9GAST|nr:hypothetical protein PoB_002928700 [Plakobranchus ocellatus]
MPYVSPQPSVCFYMDIVFYPRLMWLWRVHLCETGLGLLPEPGAPCKLQGILRWVDLDSFPKCHDIVGVPAFTRGKRIIIIIPVRKTPAYVTSSTCP